MLETILTKLSPLKEVFLKVLDFVKDNSIEVHIRKVKSEEVVRDIKLPALLTVAVFIVVLVIVIGEPTLSLINVRPQVV